MLKIFAVLLRWGFRLVLSFMVVLALLSLTPEFLGWVQPAREKAANLERVSAELAAQQMLFDIEAKAKVDATNRRIEELRSAGTEKLGQAEADARKEKQRAQNAILTESGIARAAITGNPDRIVASYRAEYIELPLADHMIAMIDLRRQNLTGVKTENDVRRDLNKRIAAHNKRHQTYMAQINRRKTLVKSAEQETRNPVCRRIAVPVACAKVIEVRKLNKVIRKAEKELPKAARKLELERDGIESYKKAGLALADGTKIVSEASAKLRVKSEQIGADSANNSINFTKSSFEKYGWWATWIVIGGALLPPLHKLLTFLFIAPLASRARSVQIMTHSRGLNASESQTSVDVPLDTDTELLVRSGVQSVSSDIEGRDVIFLKKRMALTCIAAGLVNMQRLRAARQDYVTVTAPDEEHAEVALINIPEGGAVVLQPRALVGVLKRRSDTLRIDRPWRFNFLISWVTFQFRYVVFHGPCSLIVQGQRGVRVEDAANGRMINKRLTLGFDASLAYGAARSPSFFPYLFGEESLFNDRFSGDGRYLYEQRPTGSGKGKLWGRGLKGLGDAALSAFGI